MEFGNNNPNVRFLLYLYLAQWIGGDQD
jgi:hypothetical protein